MQNVKERGKVMRRYQIMKRSQPDKHERCNTSYLPRNLMDAASAIRRFGNGLTLIMLCDSRTGEYALIRTPLDDMFPYLEFVLAQIAGSECTSIEYVEKYDAANMIVLGVTLSRGAFQINNTYQWTDGVLTHYTPTGVQKGEVND